MSKERIFVRVAQEVIKLIGCKPFEYKMAESNDHKLPWSEDIIMHAMNDEMKYLAQDAASVWALVYPQLTTSPSNVFRWYEYGHKEWYQYDAADDYLKAQDQDCLDQIVFSTLDLCGDLEEFKLVYERDPIFTPNDGEEIFRDEDVDGIHTKQKDIAETASGLLCKIAMRKIYAHEEFMKDYNEPVEIVEEEIYYEEVE